MKKLLIKILLLNLSTITLNYTRLFFMLHIYICYSVFFMKSLLTPPPALIHTTSHHELNAILPTFENNIQNTKRAIK